MTGSFKVEYEGALKDMYETHQFEARLRRLGGDLDNSQIKAKFLEEEIQKISDLWSRHYEESIRDLKQRLE